MPALPDGYAITPARYGSTLYVRRYERVMAYADAGRSVVYELDAGHRWDRLASIAGEYARGEVSWPTAQAWLDDNARPDAPDLGDSHDAGDSGDMTREA